jgi:hypothetical protein
MISAQRLKPLTDSLRPGTPDDETTTSPPQMRRRSSTVQGTPHNRLDAISSPASPTTQSWAIPVSWRRDLVVRELDRRNKLVASSGDRDQKTISITTIAKSAAQGGYMDRKIGWLNECVWPDASHELVLAD